MRGALDEAEGADEAVPKVFDPNLKINVDLALGGVSMGFGAATGVVGGKGDVFLTVKRGGATGGAIVGTSPDFLTTGFCGVGVCLDEASDFGVAEEAPA